ncbi:MAG: thiamine pyrophosphate-dependent dehydrogenase E1 component subunit alpha [Verrucomicrobiota bacterium]
MSHRSPATPTQTNDPDTSAREVYLRAHRFMLQARYFEETLASIYRSGDKIVGGVYLGKGQEAFSVAMATVLQPGDLYGPLIRDQAGRMAFGESLIDGVRTYLGSALGPMKGRDGNIHRGRPAEGVAAMISHLGSMVSVVSGRLLARRLRGDTTSIGATSIGDGGTSTGSFHEGLNLAAVEKLPLIVGVADNQFAYSTPTCRQYACEDLIDRAKGYGIEGQRIDGTSLEECLAAFQKAAERARTGNGPQMVVGKLLRLVGHGEHDDANYVSERLKKNPEGRDCVLESMRFIRERNWATDAEQASWREETMKEVEACVAQVLKEPAPDGFAECWEALSHPHLIEGRPS